METLYNVLGVDPDANPATIRAAYRERVKRHHPDVPGGDAGAFRRLTTARDVLLDDARRKRYDLLGHRRYARGHLDDEEWPVSEPSRARSRTRPRHRLRSRQRRPRPDRVGARQDRSSGSADGVVALRTYWPAVRRAGLVLLALFVLAVVLSDLSL